MHSSSYLCMCVCIRVCIFPLYFSFFSLFFVLFLRCASPVACRGISYFVVVVVFVVFLLHNSVIHTCSHTLTMHTQTNALIVKHSSSRFASHIHTRLIAVQQTYIHNPTPRKHPYIQIHPSHEWEVVSNQRQDRIQRRRIVFVFFFLSSSFVYFIGFNKNPITITIMHIIFRKLAVANNNRCRRSRYIEMRACVCVCVSISLRTLPHFIRFFFLLRRLLLHLPSLVLMELLTVLFALSLDKTMRLTIPSRNEISK